MNSADIISKKLVVVGDGVVYDAANIVKLPWHSRIIGDYIYVSDIEDVSNDTLLCFNTYDGFSMKMLFGNIFAMNVVLSSSSDEFGDVLRRRSVAIASGNCFLGMKDKSLLLRRLCDKFSIKPSDIICVDDYLENEFWLFNNIGIVISRDVSRYVDYADCELVEIRNPSHGVVRDFTNEYLDGTSQVQKFYDRTRRWKDETGPEIKSKRRTIKALALDVDGTCTDAMRILSVAGIEYKRFCTKDIEAIIRWVNDGNLIFFITGDPGCIAERFARYIGLRDSIVYADVDDRKVHIINELCKENGIQLGEFAYMGDDINDLGALEHVIEQNGIAACPQNAVPLVKNCAGIIELKMFGGTGAVAEFIDML
ncbi:MAG: hypothetical protein LBB20_01145 [Puniceicoccales bacterium]|jgi:YrbI family 3-deoxy-D-manno-octulosonate 8-phosphate phosphatase|nr:hypothetical protein [Puniceicoccales bacterium]